MTSDVSQANQIANNCEIAINEYRRRVTREMPRPNPAPQPAPLPPQLINAGPLDEVTLRRHQRRSRRRGSGPTAPPPSATCIPVPLPHYVHTEFHAGPSTQCVTTTSSTFVSEAGPSGTSFIPPPDFSFTYPSGPFFHSSGVTPHTQLPFSSSSFPSSSHHTPYPSVPSQFTEFNLSQLSFNSFLNYSQMHPSMQTPHFPSFPSSTQNFLSTFNTLQPHELPTPSHRTPPPDLNMYVPSDPNVDDVGADNNDDAQDDDDGGSQFMDMSTGRLDRRRQMGLRSRVRMRRPCDT